MQSTREGRSGRDRRRDRDRERPVAREIARSSRRDGRDSHSRSRNKNVLTAPGPGFTSLVQGEETAVPALGTGGTGLVQGAEAIHPTESEESCSSSRSTLISPESKEIDSA